MARTLNDDQRALLRAPNIKARLLTTWWMDDGTYRFTDDVNDIVFGSDTWIGASAIASAADIKSASAGWAAESVTLTIDGTRLGQSGFTDPAAFFREILTIPLANRRVDIDLGLAYEDSQVITLVCPLYAGKINNAKVTDPRMDFGPGSSSSRPASKLEIQLDSLAARYNWVVGRTRSHNDQLNIDPTDYFFSFVQENVLNEATLYWGKKAPDGVAPANTVTGGYTAYSDQPAV